MQPNLYPTTDSTINHQGGITWFFFRICPELKIIQREMLRNHGKRWHGWMIGQPNWMEVAKDFRMARSTPESMLVINRCIFNTWITAQADGQPLVHSSTPVFEICISVWLLFCASNLADSDQSSFTMMSQYDIKTLSQSIQDKNIEPGETMSLVEGPNT